MSIKRNQNYRLEAYIYLVFWILLFIIPIVSLYIRSYNYNEQFEWDDVLRVWGQYAVFLVVFLVHNYLLAPLLIYKKRKTLYFSVVSLLIATFCLVQCSGLTAPNRPSHGPVDFDKRPPLHNHDKPHRHEGPREGDAFWPNKRLADKGPKDFHKPPLIFGEHDIMSIIILLLMLAANLGTKGFFKNRNDEKRMDDLEKEHLEQQLEYLRYQINPHFLMNTLNNIHALVDIEPEQAKESIVDLSKILRFMLYEGSHTTVPIERELQFLQDYVKLMRLRISETIPVTVDIEEQCTGYNIPPLLLITFVENAFKHGISYSQPSFIDIKAAVKANRFVFTCSNSKAPESDDKAVGGIGLQNIKKRLELIYGKNYTLNIDDNAETYNITLDIPLL